MLERNKTVGFRARTLSLAIKRAVEAGKSRDGSDCTNTHGWVIGYLYDNRHKNVYQRDMEKQFGVRRPTMTEILNIMEKNGLILRVKDESDGRLKRLVLTEKAIKIHQKRDMDVENFENFIRKDITDKEMDDFFNIMDRLLANIETAEREKLFGSQEREETEND